MPEAPGEIDQTDEIPLDVGVIRQTRFFPDRINPAVLAFRCSVCLIPSFVAVTSGLLADRYKTPIPLEGLLAFNFVVLLGIGGFETMLAGHHGSNFREAAFRVLKFTCMQLFLMALLMPPIWMTLARGGLFRL